MSKYLKISGAQPLFLISYVWCLLEAPKIVFLNFEGSCFLLKLLYKLRSPVKWLTSGRTTGFNSQNGQDASIYHRIQIHSLCYPPYSGGCAISEANSSPSYGIRFDDLRNESEAIMQTWYNCLSATLMRLFASLRRFAVKEQYFFLQID